MRLAVLGLFGSPNLGNEATLAAFLHGIRTRLPSCEILCVAPRQSRAQVMHDVATIDILPLPVSPWLWRFGESRWRARAESALLRLTERLRRRRAGTALAGCVALVVPGTGVVDDFGQGPDDFPLHLDRWTAAARERGLSLHFVSVGASHIANPLSRTRLLRALLRACSCSFRDSASLVNAKALGLSFPAVVAPDLAFALPRQWLPAHPPSWPPRTVGLGVMGYRGWNLGVDAGERTYRDYLQRLTALARRLLAAGYRVHLLTGDTRADNATRDELAAALSMIGDALDAPMIENFRDLLAELGRCDVVVATRYHNLLLSLGSGRPVISLGYADKNEALLADFGQQRFVRTIDEFDPDEVATAVAGLSTGPSPYAALTARADQFRTQLETQFDELVASWHRQRGVATGVSRLAGPAPD